MILRASSVLIFVVIIIIDLLNNVLSEESWKIYRLSPEGIANNQSYLMLERLQDHMNFGISASDRYNGPYTYKYWGDSQCKNMCDDNPECTYKSLNECMDLCDANPSCTAINYSENKKVCVMRECTLPVPQPEGNDTNYVGYAKISECVTSSNCTFPFIYDGKAYDCNYKDDDTPWCVTKTDDQINDVKLKRRYNNCDEKCTDVIETKSFSICFWFNIDTFTFSPYWLSYAISDRKTNEFTIGFYKGKMYATLFGEVPDYVFQPTINWWHHLCVVWHQNEIMESKRGLILYIDGIFRREVEGPVGPLYLNGTLVVGQEQDSLGGGFSKNSAFLGSITQLNMWNHDLNDEEIKQMSKCNMISHEPALKWENLTWITSDSIRENYGNPCEENELPHKILIPSKVELYNAKRICETLGMNLQVPQSKEEDQDSRLTIQNAPSICLSEFFSSPSAYIGVKYEHQNGSNGSWKDVNSKQQVKYLGFVDNDNRNWEFWNHAMIIVNINYWQQINAEIISCPLCNGTRSTTKIYLRGLCKAEKAHPNTYMIFYARSNKKNVLSLDGVAGLRIFYRQDKDKDKGDNWVLKNDISNTTIAVHEGDHFPLGIHKWTLYDTSSICKFPLKNHIYPYTRPRKNEKERLFTLSLSACGPDQFPCSDGTCINMTQRCSIRPDCKEFGNDYADEQDCNLLVIPPRYLTDMQPPQETLHINIMINITKIIAMKISEQLIQMNFDVSLQWKDERLSYRNLRSSLHQNRLNMEELDNIWTPEVQVFNEQRLLPAVKPTIHAAVKRKGDNSRTDNDLIYRGSDNPIIYNLHYSKNLDCTMNMVLYPFNAQNCTIILKLDNVDPDNVRFTSSQLNQLLENQVLGGYTIANETLTVDGNMVHLTFHLLNQPTYHLFALYMPTILLHIIGYGTFAISVDDFQDRATMSLTNLLVLMALYSDTLATLPQTSYLKCIDIWFIFSILFLSSIIAVHLITNDTPDKLSHGLHVTNALVLFWSKICFGIVYIVFQITHWIYVIVNT